MPDIGKELQHLAKAKPKKVALLDLEAQIQDRRSRIARFKQDIEDYERMFIKQKQSEILMLEEDLKILAKKLADGTPEDAEIVDI